MKNRFNQLQAFIKKNKLTPLVDVFIFAVIILFFHQLWWVWGLKKFLLQYMSFGELEQIMVNQVYYPSKWIVEHIIGYDINSIDATATMYFPNNGYVQVVGSCSGLKQFYQWIFLMVLFPGPWKDKLWYIPLGLVVIHIVNILRIVGLSVTVMVLPQYWDFIHLWIFRVFFYVVIFVLWVIWVEKFRHPKEDVKTTISN